MSKVLPIKGDLEIFDISFDLSVITACRILVPPISTNNSFSICLVFIGETITIFK